MAIRRLSDDIILDVNASFQTLFGLRRQDVVGKAVGELAFYPIPDARKQILALIERGDIAKGMELEPRRRCGGNVPVLMTVNVLTILGEQCVLATFTDLSHKVAAEQERLTLQEEPRQSQKMRALGSIASGIAHDSNNILLAITGNLDPLAENLPPGSAGASAMDVIRLACPRAADLMRQITIFSRRDLAARSVIELGPCVEEAARLISAQPWP